MSKQEIDITNIDKQFTSKELLAAPLPVLVERYQKMLEACRGGQAENYGFGFATSLVKICFMLAMRDQGEHQKIHIGSISRDMDSRKANEVIIYQTKLRDHLSFFVNSLGTHAKEVISLLDQPPTSTDDPLKQADKKSWTRSILLSVIPLPNQSSAIS